MAKKELFQVMVPSTAERNWGVRLYGPGWIPQGQPWATLTEAEEDLKNFGEGAMVVAVEHVSAWKKDEKGTFDLAEWEPERMVIEFKPDFDTDFLEEDEVIEFELDPIAN